MMRQFVAQQVSAEDVGEAALKGRSAANYLHQAIHYAAGARADDILLPISRGYRWYPAGTAYCAQWQDPDPAVDAHRAAGGKGAVVTLARSVDETPVVALARADSTQAEIWRKDALVKVVEAPGTIRALSWSQDDGTVVGDGDVKLLALATTLGAAFVSVGPEMLNGAASDASHAIVLEPRRPVLAMCWFGAPDQRQLAVGMGEDDGTSTVHIYAPTTPASSARVIRVATGTVRALAPLPGGQWLACAVSPTHVRIRPAASLHADLLAPTRDGESCAALHGIASRGGTGCPSVSPSSPGSSEQAECIDLRGQIRATSAGASSLSSHPLFNLAIGEADRGGLDAARCLPAQGTQPSGAARGAELLLLPTAADSGDTSLVDYDFDAEITNPNQLACARVHSAHSWVICVGSSTSSCVHLLELSPGQPCVAGAALRLPANHVCHGLAWRSSAEMLVLATSLVEAPPPFYNPPVARCDMTLITHRIELDERLPASATSSHAADASSAAKAAASKLAARVPTEAIKTATTTTHATRALRAATLPAPSTSDLEAISTKMLALASAYGVDLTLAGTRRPMVSVAESEDGITFTIQIQKHH